MDEQQPVRKNKKGKRQSVGDSLQTIFIVNAAPDKLIDLPPILVFF